MIEDKILIIDLETTLLIKKGKIVEIGMVELDLKNGATRIVYDKVLHEKGITKEECDNSWIVNNTSLTTDEIRVSPELSTEFSTIQYIINKYAGCTAFNSQFDLMFMDDRGFTFPKKLGCLMKLSAPICKIPPTPKMKQYRPNIPYKNPNAEEAFKYFFPYENYIELHRGADDALHEAKVAYELYKLGVLKV